MSKKYELTNETITFAGRTLWRIRALRDIEGQWHEVEAGALGGWVESEANLSQNGGAWIMGDAKVFGKAVVSEYAVVADEAVVKGEAQIKEYATISHQAVVEGRAIVDGSAAVRDTVHVGGNAHIGGTAVLNGRAAIRAEAFVESSEDYMVFQLSAVGHGVVTCYRNKGNSLTWNDNGGEDLEGSEFVDRPLLLDNRHESDARFMVVELAEKLFYRHLEEEKDRG